MDKLPPRSILIDFDGTVVGHSYPDLGPDLPHAVRVIQRLEGAGHTLILLTMRNGQELLDAEQWFIDRGITIKYVNCNPEFETGSRKVYGNYSIDDHNIAIPLIHNREFHHKPYVDWMVLEEKMERMGLI